jgi:hypothetical protein
VSKLRELGECEEKAVEIYAIHSSVWPLQANGESPEVLLASDASLLLTPILRVHPFPTAR